MERDISLVIPTYNRAFALELTVQSFYKQKHLKEIIFVDDCSNDQTKELIAKIANKHDEVQTLYLRNSKRKGVVNSRIYGYNKAQSKYVLFCDDDVVLAENYSEICRRLIEEYEDVGVVTGRLVIQESDEPIEDAIKKFQNNQNFDEYFNFSSFCFRINGKLQDNSEVPLSHSIMLTKREYLLQDGFDPFYSRGNSYREESDYQANLLHKGLKTIVSNKTYCMHLNKKKISYGGNRLNVIQSLYWNIYFSNYFFSKHFSTYRLKYPNQVSKSKIILILKVSLYQLLILVIKPIFRKTTFFL